MLNWIFIQTLLHPDNNGKWLARWRWDNKWAEGCSRAQAIFNLKEDSLC